MLIQNIDSVTSIDKDTLVLNKTIFDESNFSDGVHFNLKGMDLFTSQITDYIVDNNRPTTIKERFMVDGYKLLQLDIF